MGAEGEVFVRRDAWNLPEGDETMHWYAVGVGAMKERRAEDPTSWAYQAAMHGSHIEPALALWNECKHESWYFTAWHRMYLFFFEQIVRAAVVEAGGPEDWALPYWNYGLGGEAAKLPIPFREEGSSLFVEQRAEGINSGEAEIPEEAGSDAGALARPEFIGTIEFGGGASPPEHFSGEKGVLEQTPHGIVHVLVGGKTGWMTDPDEAAQDPIFWLHHSNIDRIWAQWNSNGGVNPENGGWLEQEFEFFDAGGNAVAMKVSDTLDIVGDLGYTYDSLPEPAPEPGPAEGEPEPLAAAVNPPNPEPKVVGATEEKLTLVGSATVVPVAIDQRARAEVAEASNDADPRHVILNVEEIEAEVNPGSAYGIYVNLPENPDPEALKTHHVGNLSFFGIEHAQKPRGDKPAHSPRLSVDIGGVLDSLDVEQEGQVKVSFLPINLIGGEGAKHAIGGPGQGVAAETESDGEDPPVQIGRVSLSVG
jgi:tyrosinase